MEAHLLGQQEVDSSRAMASRAGSKEELVDMAAVGAAGDVAVEGGDPAFWELVTLRQFSTRDTLAFAGVFRRCENTR